MISSFLGVRIFDLEACGACNLACTFCPRELLPPTGNMSMETFKSFMNGVQLGSTDTLSFVGIGEPLLNRNLPEFVRFSKKEYPAARTWITSNGTLLNAYFVPRLLDAGLDTLDVSFNGLNKTDYETAMKGAQFEKVLSNLEYTAETIRHSGANTQLQINFILDRTNAKDEETIKNFWRDRGIDRFRVQHLHDRAGSASLGSDMVTDEPGLRCGTCAIFKLVTFITWEGDVMYCCHDIPRVHKIANVNRHDWQEISKRKRAIMRAKNWPDLCGSCTDPLRHNMTEKIDQMIYKELRGMVGAGIESTLGLIRKLPKV